MIECVSIATNHCFPGNLLAEQHALRYREVIAKEGWDDIYIVDQMEFDRYDNLATEYFVARDAFGKVVGVARSYPTTIPYMLSDVFGFLFSRELPRSPKVFEASRLVLDRSLLSKEQRKPVIDKLVVAYMERALQRRIDAYVGFMLPKIWASTFQRAGWDVVWVGPEVKLRNSDDIVQAAWMPVSEEMDAKVRRTTGIQESVLSFGAAKVPPSFGVAMYSNAAGEERRVA